MDAEVATVVRNLGVVLVLFSLVMLAMIPFIGPVMLGMDIPMLLVGIGMAAYGHWKLRHA